MKSKYQPVFTSFLVKVASRCNLNCTYCYMYNHADQSWKNKPYYLSEEHQELFASRLADYVAEKKCDQILIIYHGGEPLLFGVDRMILFTQLIRQKVEPLGCRIDFGVQTNGVLLKEEMMPLFEKHKISVSLSIDGPQEIHDTFRLNHRGKPSFEKVLAALRLLKKYPNVFSGCLAVINPNFQPQELFSFFEREGIKAISLLIPDANYLSPPIGRDQNPDLYKTWLLNAFDCWFDHYPHIECKFFESIMASFLGHIGASDALGLGSISMLNLETDGEFHDLDVLKITEENSSYLGMNLKNNAIADAEQSEKIQSHCHLLTKEGLSETCQKCTHVDICGGGSVPHRFSADGYRNPTIYCREMYSLIDHIMLRMQDQMTQNKKIDLLKEFSLSEMEEFWNENTSKPWISQLQKHLFQKNRDRLLRVTKWIEELHPELKSDIAAVLELPKEKLHHLLLQPTTFAWLRAQFGHAVGAPVRNTEEGKYPIDPHYISYLRSFAQQDGIAPVFIFQSPDPWFSLSLPKSIVLNHSKANLEEGVQFMQQALACVKEYSPSLYNEILQVSPHIQLVKDLDAHPDKDVSFSDETLPGAIFIGAWKGSQPLCTYMIAASIIHEHLHQKLYLLQQRFSLFPPQDTLIFSPWPKTLRPPVGALHAVYVFTHVARFWRHVTLLDNPPSNATDEFNETMEKLDQCISDLHEKAIFTQTGSKFFTCVRNAFLQLSHESSLTKV